MVALQTFLNLSPERQQEIIQAALEEFAQKDYESASLSDIIKALALAKGSFYRYFENKQMLYLFLLNHCLETRLKHDQGLVKEKKEEDFFELFTRHFEARLQFEKKFPLHSTFLHALLRQKTVPELEEVQQAARKKIVSLLLPRIQSEVQKGKLRKDLEPELMAFMMSQIYMLLAEYNLYKQSEGKGGLAETEVLKTGKSFIEIIKNGLLKRDSTTH